MLISSVKTKNKPKGGGCGAGRLLPRHVPPPSDPPCVRVRENVDNGCVPRHHCGRNITHLVRSSNILFLIHLPNRTGGRGDPVGGKEDTIIL